jgi:hypothetical protein
LPACDIARIITQLPDECAQLLLVIEDVDARCPHPNREPASKCCGPAWAAAT